MDARLPLNPNLGFYRKQAKELKRSLAVGDPAATARLAAHHPKRVPSDASLGDAQLVIAREHGFASWAEFKRAVENAARVPQASAADRLMAAIRSDELDAARRLLAADRALANQPDSKGVLPLVEACDRGVLALVELLLDAGADLREGDPVLAAAHAGPYKRGPAMDVVELLVRRGVPDDIFLHATLGRVDPLAKELPDANLEARGPANATALFLAAWNGQIEAVRLLLDAGADANPICRGGQSAWEVVCLHLWSNAHREIARMLLERGVTCSLEEACILSHLPTVRALIARDAEAKEERGPNGKTPLELALLNADVELARTLLDAGAADPGGRARALIDAAPETSQNHSGTLYRNCSFENANFHDATLANAVFSDVNLSGALFDNVNLAGVRIDNANTRGLTIYGIEVGPLLDQELERRAKAKERAR